MRSIGYFVCIICISLHQISAEDTLRAVEIIYRHGDRNPIKSYPTDPFNDLSHWPGGWGALTYDGKLKLFNLGKYMKQRYPQISKENVVALSSDKTRTILSGMANLAGFSGQDQYILNQLEQMNHSVFGLRVVPSVKDDIIYLLSVPCKKLTKLWEYFITKSDAAKRFGEKYRKVITSINQNTGQNYSSFSLQLLIQIDTLLIEKKRAFIKPEYPQWANELYSSGDLSNMFAAGFPLMLYTHEIRRLRLGSMFKTYFDRMDAVIDESTSPSKNPGLKNPKMTIISGHDFTLASWLISLEVYNGIGPPYGSALFIELHETDKKDEDEYIIEIFYKNETDSEPYLMSIPMCPNPCSYELLKLILTPLIVEDREKECQLQDGTISSSGSGIKVNLHPFSELDSENTKIESSSGATFNFPLISGGFFLICLKLLYESE